MRRSWLATGRLPRRAQRRVRGFFWRAASRPGTTPRWVCPVAACARSPPSARGILFERRDVLGNLRVMPRAGADVRKAQPEQQLADRPLVVVNAEATADQRLQVEAAPAHDAVGLGLRTRLDQRRELGLLSGGQPRRGTRRLPVDQPGRTRGVEPVHPIPQRLTVHAAQRRRRRPAHPVVHRRDRQQTPRLTASSADRAASRTRTASQSDRKGTAGIPSLPAACRSPMNHAATAPTTPIASQPQRRLV